MNKPIQTIFRETRADKKPKQLHFSYYLSDTERREIIKELGDGCCILMDYYMRFAGAKDINYSDERVAEHLGYTVRKVQECRKKLQKAGWFYQIKYNHKTERPLILTILGKNAVTDFHRYTGLSFSELGEMIKLSDDMAVEEQSPLFE